jgi:hypothetical protein
MPTVSKTITGTPHADLLWTEVGPTGVASKEQVVPNNETWEIIHFIGAAAFLDDTEVRIVWDYGGAGETILALTHGDLNTSLSMKVTGDGVKKIALVAINDTLTTRALGGSYEAVDA